MATSTVSVSNSAFTSLGTATTQMMISPQGKIQFIAAAAQPSPGTPAHPLAYATVPFLFPFAQQVWAISMEAGPVNCVVTV